jgi:hypothetical protein
MSSQEALSLLRANQAIVAKLSAMPPSNNPVLRALQVMTNKARNLRTQEVSMLLAAAILGHRNGEVSMTTLYDRLKTSSEMLTAFYHCIAGFHDKLGEGILTMILRSDQAFGLFLRNPSHPRDWSDQKVHKYYQFRQWLVLPETIKDSTKVPRLIKDDLDVKCKL